MIKVTGKNGIVAEIVLDSFNNGVRITTMQLTYPRFIHSEFMTHRVFSRNAASSRAIPIKKTLEQVDNDPAMPIYWGSNRPGMQAGDELEGEALEKAKTEWIKASIRAAEAAEKFDGIGLHKQIANRVLEPWQFMKTVVTATEWENFYALRCHPAAQPEIHELAECMKQAHELSSPKIFDSFTYHLPYILQDELDNHPDFSDLVKASVARCARVSYKNHDNTDPDMGQDIQLHDTLYKAGHMSPFEHIAKPIVMIDIAASGWVGYPGITHRDTHGDLWSGNFRGWVQYRQLL